MPKSKKKTNEDILDAAKERFRNSLDSDKDEREQAYKDTCFAIDHEGCQWPADIRTNRETDSPPRPCLVLNKIPEKIDQVEGEFRQLRPSVKIRGVDSQADPKVAEILSGIVRHIEYNSNAHSEAYNTSHSSTLYSGRGAWRIDIEDAEEDPFIRDIKINRIPNVLTVYWDPASKKLDKSDSDYFFVTEEINRKNFKAEYPDEELGQDWEADAKTWEDWRTDEKIRIAEYWWREKEKRKFYRVRREVEGQEPEEFTTDEPIEFIDEVLEEKEVSVPKIKWCKMISNRILEGPHGHTGKYIPIIIEIGKEVNVSGQAKTRGMVRFAKEPQQMYNYWSSTATETYALAPKSPYLATSAMLHKHLTQWNQANTKNYPFLLWEVDPKAPGLGPKRELPPQVSSAIAHELIRMEHDIMSSMGIYQASLGDEGQEKSGKAITARQRQGSIGSYTFTSNFQTALAYSTKILIDLIPKVYDTERILRIRGEDDTEKTVPINARPNAPFMQQGNNEFSPDLISEPRENVTEYVNDLSVGKYDVAVTIGPSYTTQREEAAAMLIDLVKAFPQIGMAAIDIIVANLDIPGSDELISRVKKMIPPELKDPEPGEEGQQAQEQPPDPQVMIEMQKLQMEEREQDRKDFETQIKAIVDMMKVDADERKGDLLEIKEIIAGIQQPQPTG